jgi:hypothetical protein
MNGRASPRPSKFGYLGDSEEITMPPAIRERPQPFRMTMVSLAPGAPRARIARPPCRIVIFSERPYRSVSLHPSAAAAHTYIFIPEKIYLDGATQYG